MGSISGGFIVKDGETLSDKEILGLLDRRKFKASNHITMEEAMSRKFYGVGIARIGNVAMVVGVDVAFSFSFENEQLSKSDSVLENLSKKSEILCYSINSIAETYAWSVFKNGKRTRVKCIAESKTVFDWGTKSEYEKGVEASEAGIIGLIENFTHLSYLDILSEKNKVVAYNG